jgi:hypothetical protein
MPDVTMNAGRVNIVITADGANFSQAMNAASKQLDTFGSKGKRAGHAAISSMQAASASIRLMEGDITHNVRAVERWITTFPGVGNALKNLFPLVGGIAFAGMIGEVGNKVVEFVQKTRQIPDNIKLGFQQMNDSARLANDSLAVTNDRLANEIAKLQGKPQNSLALALDEARVNADKLADSLDADERKVKALLSANSNGVLQQLVGKGTTSNVQGNIENFQKQMAAAAEDARSALGSGDQAGATAAQARLAQLQKNALAYTDQQLAGRVGSQAATAGNDPGSMVARYLLGDQSANIEALQGFRGMVSGQQAKGQLQSRNDDLEKQRAELQAKKDLAKEQAEAQRQADQAQMEAFQQGLADLKNAHELSVGEEYSYWSNRLNATRNGSRNYLAVSREMGTLYQQVLKENGEITKSASKEWGELQPTTYGLFTGAVQPQAATSSYGGNDLSKSDEPLMRSQSSATVEYLKNLNEGVAIRRQSADAIAEMSIGMQVATGQMSKLDAAEAVAALHAQQYTGALEKLQESLKAIASDPSLSTTDKNAQSSKVQNEIDALSSSRMSQVIEESSAIDTGTLSGSIREAMNLYVQQATDTAAQIRDIMTSAFESVNSSLSSSLVAKAPNSQEYWRNVRNGLGGAVRGVASQGLNSGMQQLEGGVLGRFGLGGGKKPVGTASDPLWVRIAGALGLSGGGGAGLSIPGMPDLQTSNESGGSGLTSMIPEIASFLPGLATGGPTPANMPRIVGEKGKEVWWPDTAGTVIPNNQLGGNVTQHTHYHSVDARGSSDPNAVHAAVNRAMKAYVPHIVGASVAAQSDMKRRTPSSRG